MDRIRVFICYKKILSREQGNKQVIQENTQAEIFQYLLGHEPRNMYDPWMDDSGLTPGMRWETEIYRQLLISDVMVVLIGPGTAMSEWVRREIALANALGISIVPVGFDLTEEQMLEEAKALSISDLQWTITKNIRLNRGAALIAELEGALDKSFKATRERQRTTLHELWGRRLPAREKAKNNQRAKSFTLRTSPSPVSLHVASGDIMKIRNIDVIVNSENDYMQMARFFESHAVSSMLRRHGASVRDGRYHDTIQQELDWQLRERGRPVLASEVFATSAGGPDSTLAKVNKARVILHVAAVEAVDAESRVIPYKHPQQIESSVRAVLSSVTAVNQVHGVISPPGSAQRADQERLAAAGQGELKSVIFPLLGTGQGGAPTSEIIGPMIDGILGFISEDENQYPDQLLQDIYISAFFEDDVDIVTSVIEQRLA